MSKFLFSGVIFLFLSLQLISQSYAIDLNPVFLKQQQEYITSPIELEKPLEDPVFIGLSCYHTASISPHLSYRVFSEDIWSTWEDFHALHEYVAYPRHAYEAKAILDPIDKIQFKSLTPIQDELTYRLFYAGTDRQQMAMSTTRNLDCVQPEFCDRSCWCPTCPIDVTPQITDPTHIIVHHSAGFNESNDFASVVEYYWDLHVNTNGWDDIGYNWLIDANGVIYQGRPDNFQGAHFSCINENTVGICVIGDFTNTTPTDEAIESLTQLIGFEASDHQIDVLDASYHETGDFITENISGHRDAGASANSCSSTVCPGDSFYPLLGELREAVSALECYQDAISNVLEISALEYKVYPSPFRNMLYINSVSNPTENLELISSAGIVTMKLKINQVNNTSQVEPGIYFIRQGSDYIGKTIKY